jgi:hypothetical protein
MRLPRKLGGSVVLVMVLLFWLVVVAVPPVKANFRTLAVPDDYSTIDAAIGNAADGDIVCLGKESTNTR